jgi:Big-like domain-containing protein
MQDPPGGPPDAAAPVLLAVRPESGSIVPDWRDAAVLQFDEVITEMASGGRRGTGGLDRLVLLSPTTEPVDVSWHRREIHVRPDEGWRPGRIYHLELLPGITDLRNNRLGEGRLVVFSTGPAIPTTRVTGTAVQWEQQSLLRGNGLVEAVLLPDSLPYRAVTDSTGTFRFRSLPAGNYLVWVAEDRNTNRQRDPNEPFDTVRVRVDSTAELVAWVFQHDTLGPRLRTADVEDSVTLKLTFAAGLSPFTRVDTSHVSVVALPDSTPVAVTGVQTAAERDSLRAAARAVTDTTSPALAGDTAAAPPAPPRDTAARRPPPGAGAGRGVPAPGAPAPQQDTVLAALLRQRPKPYAILYLRTAAPLTPGSRYLVRVRGVPNLSGVTGETQAVAVRRESQARPQATPERP